MQLRNLDDWLAWENVVEEENFLTQDEIRHLNSEFNYKHYGYFYEKLEEAQNEEEIGIDALSQIEEDKGD